jgi:HEAT repeat protein
VSAAWTLLVEAPRDGVTLTCAVIDPATGDAYVGSTQGVLVRTAATGAVNHVKLKGERMLACAAGGGAVWFAGEEHLVRFDSGQARTTKLARRDFGIAAGQVTALHVEGDVLWVGMRAARSDSPLFRIEVGARRVMSYAGARNRFGAGVRGIARFGDRVWVLCDDAVVFPSDDGTVAPGEHASGSRSPWVGASALAKSMARLTDRGFLGASGGRLFGRDERELFVVSGPDSATAPWPPFVARMGAAAVAHPAGGLLVGTALGLIHCDGVAVIRHGGDPVVALLDGDPVRVLTPRALYALPGALSGGVPFAADLENHLHQLAKHALAHGTPEARCEALAVLVTSSEADDRALFLSAFDDPIPAVRVHACVLAEKHHVAEAHAKLTAMAAEPEPEIKLRAMLALVALGDTATFQGLVDTIRALPPAEAQKSLRELTRGGGEGSIAVLRPFVLDDRPVVRRSALLHLGKLGFPQNVLSVIAMLERSEAADRERGARMLASEAEPLAAYLLAAHMADGDAAVRRAAFEAFAQRVRRVGLPDEVRPAVARYLTAEIGRTGENSGALAALIELAEQVADDAGLGLLETALKHPDPRARRAGLAIIGKRRLREHAPFALAALRETDDHVRAAAVSALERLGDPRALAPLVALLQEPGVFLTDPVGGTGYRLVSRAIATIAGLSAPAEALAGNREAWLAWYQGTLLPALARFGLLGSTKRQG